MSEGRRLGVELILGQRGARCPLKKQVDVRQVAEQLGIVIDQWAAYVDRAISIEDITRRGVPCGSTNACTVAMDETNEKQEQEEYKKGAE
jgi:hypothetical protein